jgi:AcrR family transcriptional regulator
VKEVVSARLRDAGRTRQRILTAARAAFAAHGYDGTTVREVAADADVAPNLITRYFGGKAGLFQAATMVELGVPETLPGPWASLGERIARQVVARWSGAPGDDPLLMMVRSAGSSPEAATALASFFAAQAARPLTLHVQRERECTRRHAEDVAGAVGALIMGTVMARYVMNAGPLAGKGDASLRRWLAVMVQQLLEAPMIR